FPPRQAFPIGSFPGNMEGLAVADVDGDGRPDIVTATSAIADGGTILPGGVSVRVNTTPGGSGVLSFGPEQTFASGPNPSDPQSVAVADVNRDGKPDLVAANYVTKTLSALANTAEGRSFPPPSPLPPR